MRSSFASFRQNMMSVMRMNMAAVSTVTLLLLCCSVVASQGSENSCDVFAETNKDFNLALNHKLKKSERLKWKFQEKDIFDHDGLIYLEGKEGDVTANGSLVIKKANKSNDGEYKPEVFDQNGREVGNLKSTKLCVIDPPPTPTVQMVCVQSTKNVKFTCKVGKVGETLQTTWHKNAEVVKSEKSMPHLMYKAETVENDEFRCTVSNRVGNMTSQPVKQDCHKSGFVFPEDIWGINTWILVAIGGGVVVLLIIIIIVCCVCNRRKKRLQIKDEEELRLGWANNQPQHPHQHNHPPHQHQHHHHHHHQQQPAGHTGPRQPRSRQQRNHPLPRTPDQANGQPQPSPRRPAQAPTPANNCDEEQPPPLPQPRKKAPKTPRA